MRKTKSFFHSNVEFVLEVPEKTEFENDFLREIYTELFDLVVDGNASPHINCDKLKPEIIGKDLYQIGRQTPRAKLKKVSPKSSDINAAGVQTAVEKLCEHYPVFVTFVKNCPLKADVVIQHAELIIGEKVGIDNFMKIKKFIGNFHKLNWKDREMNNSERQASNANLGQISEGLLEKAMADAIDDKNFIKVNDKEVKSYGDFLVTCLPNNLWLSVKSNFSRERLLASGYSNDILGVGFFEDCKEFITKVRIRNMQRAGFLCLYIPDEPVTLKQEDMGTNTYLDAVKHFKDNGLPMPLNINGTQFFRPLSELSVNLGTFLAESNMTKRFSVRF